MIGLPSRTRWRGVSRFEPNQPWRRVRRRKAKSGLHPSMQAVRLSRWRNLHFHANPDSGACSLGQDRGRPASRRPLPQSTEPMSFPSFRAIHADVLKGMISYRIGFSECAHGRASKGQHARRPLFIESCPACQGQNSDQIAYRSGEFGPEMAGNFLGQFRHTGAASLVLATGGSHAASDSSNSRDPHPL